MRFSGPERKSLMEQRVMMRQGDQVLTDHNMRKKKNKTHHKAYRWQVRIVQKIDLRGVFETSLLMIYSFNFF